jgi:hypothetical protein
MSVDLSRINKDNVVEIIRQTNLDDIKDTQTLRSLLKLVQNTSLTDLKSPNPIRRAHFITPHTLVWRRAQGVVSVHWDVFHFRCIEKGIYGERAKTYRGSVGLGQLEPIDVTLSYFQHIWCRGKDEICISENERADNNLWTMPPS